RVPDPSTLMKLTKRLGPALLEELNAGLLSLAVERKVLRSRRLRVDTTVVEADIRSPTDSGLCAHAVSRLTRLAKRLQTAGLAPRTSLRDRRRSVGKRVRQISAALNRGGRTRATVDRLTGEIAGRARRTLVEAPARARRRRGCTCAPCSPIAASRPSLPTTRSRANKYETASSRAASALPRSSRHAPGDAATDTATASRAASHSSNARGSPALAC